MSQVKFKLSMTIDNDKVPGPAPMVTVGVLHTKGREEERLVSVLAHNWDPSDDGARAIASLLRETANAIELQVGIAQQQQPRPRFNPQPRRFGPASEGGA